MKISKTILFVLLIVKTSLAGSMTLYAPISCCSEESTEICAATDSSESEDKDCCQGPECDCLCCGHIFITDVSELEETFNITPLYTSQFNYEGLNGFQSQFSIWHPPKLL